MPLQTILAVLTGDDADRSVLDAAIALTSPEPIAITALHVKADPQTTLPLFREGLSSAMIGEVVASMERETTARARKARAVFDTWCGDAKITARASDSGSALTSSAATWRELVGQEDDEVALVARNVDVVLLARRDDMRGTDLVAFCLFNSGRPMLLAPPSVPAKLGGHIGIFWNGGVQSARAVGDAMPLLRRSDRITVYTTGAEGPAPSAGDLARRLSQAGMTTMVDMVSPGIKSAAGPLLEAAERDDVDLIVMGGFGHGRFRELIFGGVTKAVVQNSRVAAFLSH